MILGPIQTAWVESLDKHPERQTKHVLGRLHHDGSYEACVLGQCSICLNGESVWKKSFNPGFSGYLDSGHGHTASLCEEDFKNMGLRSPYGEILEGWDGYLTLSEANDDNKTWTEIAAFIRANPEKVFTKSV